jgi:hypothetical protein
MKLPNTALNLPPLRVLCALQRFPGLAKNTRLRCGLTLGR